MILKVIFANSVDPDQTAPLIRVHTVCLYAKIGLKSLQKYSAFVCVEVLRPSQPNGVMSSAVSLPNHMFTGQALSSKRLTSIVHILSPEKNIQQMTETDDIFRCRFSWHFKG